MKIAQVWVPAELWRDCKLPASAKLVWMASRLQSQPGQAGSAFLQAHCGLSRPTVLRGVARLAATLWSLADSGAGTDPSGTAPHITGPGGTTPRGAAPAVNMPGDLLADRSVGMQAKLLYGWLQLAPGGGRRGQLCVIWMITNYCWNFWPKEASGTVRRPRTARRRSR